MADSDKREPSRGTRRCLNIASPSYKGLVQKVEVQTDDDRGGRPGQDRGHGLVDQRAHGLLPLGEHHQRDDGERQPEAQQDLADDERARGVQADEDDDQRGDHRGQPADPRRDAPLEEALHDHLARHGAHRGGGETRGEQGEAEHPACRLAQERLEGLVRFFQGADLRESLA